MPSVFSKFSTDSFRYAKNNNFRNDFSGLSHRGKCLTGVVIEVVDGMKCPKLLFGDSRLESMESPTEDEFAAVLRAVYHCSSRPEFFFLPIQTPHPYAGRQYCYYSLQWLRGTRLGKLLIEADVWMKMLANNVKPREAGDYSGEQPRFVAWSKNSRMSRSKWREKHDFADKSCEKKGSIFLKCKEVVLNETENRLFFPTDPLMQIEYEANLEFGNYLTSIYDDVALCDAPVLERIRELPKMIVIAEWLKKKGLEIDQKWLWEQTQPNPSAIPQTFQNVTSLSDSNTKGIIVPFSKKAVYEHEVAEKLRCTLARSAYEAGDVVLTSVGPVRRKIDYEVLDVSVSGSRHVFQAVERCYLAGVTDCVIQRQIIVRASDSDDDVDWIYEGLNPNVPINGAFSTLNVESWFELQKQSIEPFCNILIDDRSKKFTHGWGGCSMESFPTKHVSKSSRELRRSKKASLKLADHSIPMSGVQEGSQIGGTVNFFQPGATNLSNSRGDTVCNASAVKYSVRETGVNTPHDWGTMTQDQFRRCKPLFEMSPESETEESRSSLKEVRRVLSFGAQSPVEQVLQDFRESNRVKLRAEGSEKVDLELVKLAKDTLEKWSKSLERREIKMEEKAEELKSKDEELRLKDDQLKIKEGKLEVKAEELAIKENSLRADARKFENPNQKNQRLLKERNSKKNSKLTSDNNGKEQKNNFPADDSNVTDLLLKACANVGAAQWEYFGSMLLKDFNPSQWKENATDYTTRLLGILNVWKQMNCRPKVKKLLGWFEKKEICRKAIESEHQELCQLE